MRRRIGLILLLLIAIAACVSILWIELTDKSQNVPSSEQTPATDAVPSDTPAEESKTPQ